MMPTFREIYEGILMALIFRGHKEENARTGAIVHVGPPQSFTLDLSSGNLPVCGIRKTFPRSAAAEVAWFLQGHKSVEFIRQYAPLWDKFVEDDGDTVAGAYGHRWRLHFDRDQIGDAITTLAQNPTDRRIFISAWDPAIDGLGRPSKNVPCPVGFTLSITGNTLNSTLLIRSSDVFVGLPYDVMGHALLMKAVQVELARVHPGLTLGYMHVCLAHPHVYGVHREMALEALRSASSDSTFKMPGSWSVTRIENDPHGYVRDISDLARTLKQPEYFCRPEVIQ